MLKKRKADKKQNIDYKKELMQSIDDYKSKCKNENPTIYKVSKLQWTKLYEYLKLITIRQY